VENVARWRTPSSQRTSSSMTTASLTIFGSAQSRFVAGQKSRLSAAQCSVRNRGIGARAEKKTEIGSLTPLVFGQLLAFFSKRYPEQNQLN
jgi:hypothetical protein